MPKSSNPTLPALSVANTKVWYDAMVHFNAGNRATAASLICRAYRESSFKQKSILDTWIACYHLGGLFVRKGDKLFPFFDSKEEAKKIAAKKVFARTSGKSLSAWR